MKTKLSRLAFVSALGATFSLLLLCGCATNVRDTSRTFHTVVIDAGHGGHDSGTTSRAGGAEKNATLEVAQRLDEKLRADGFHTVLTRTGDYFVPLDTRAAISNSQNNAIFVSVHFNDSPKRGVRGIETYYNSAYALPLAEKIQQSLALLSESRGFHHANFRVLRKNRFPAVLVECGFLSNRSEAGRCASSGYQDAVAARIADGVSAQHNGRLPLEQDAFAAAR
jgi:N-acetylmuramoyl-L-alanine amidase